MKKYDHYKEGKHLMLLLVRDGAKKQADLLDNVMDEFRLLCSQMHNSIDYCAFDCIIVK